MIWVGLIRFIIIKNTPRQTDTMVEAENLEDQTEKTFVEDTAILDKLKAAAAVTDGEYLFY